MNNPLFLLQNKAQFIQKLQQLKASGCDPNRQIQEMLNSGKISQSDYDRAVERAKELQRIFNI